MTKQQVVFSEVEKQEVIPFYNALKKVYTGTI
jgi:hypothetical protein